MQGVPKTNNVDETDVDEIKVCEIDLNEEEETALNAAWKQIVSDKSFLPQARNSQS